MIKGLPKVLVVDDEQDILELIRHSLAKEGFEVHVAANGAQAIEQARKVKPEIIIMDVMMPVMDGMEACRQLKDNPTPRTSPSFSSQQEAKSSLNWQALKQVLMITSRNL